jgi:exodeoxyribonuclease V alpha subunit
MAISCTLVALGAGSVCCDLGQPDYLFRGNNQPIEWPEPQAWAEALMASPAVSASDDQGDGALIVQGTTSYLRRYYREQSFIASWITQRSQLTQADNRWVDLFFADEYANQRTAGARALSSQFCVVAGGPGTGKTTIVARLLAALAQNRPSGIHVVLAAPTGKAAARLDQAVRENLQVCSQIPGADYQLTCESGTIHRILQMTPWGKVGRDANNPIPADIVVVDEASMLSLHLMTLLLHATSESTSLILVGDPDQLASIEAGAVLSDIVSQDQVVPVARLTTTYRFSGAIADLAESIRCGDSDTALNILGSGCEQIQWIDADLDSMDTSHDVLDPLREDLLQQQKKLTEFSARGAASDALSTLESHRLLVAHRHGVSGVSFWTHEVRSWLFDHHLAPPAHVQWYAGLPLLITRNDDVLGIYNGDSGVMINDNNSLVVAMETNSGVRTIDPGLIQGWEPLFASTIHKAQGSQFDTVSVLVPGSSALILSRELLYTAITRAQRRLRIIGSASTLSQAIQSPALRASGLATQLSAPRS